MANVELQVNGKPLVFSGDSVSYGGYVLYYTQMSNIAHRSGEQPAFLFDYNGKRLALPYDPKDKDAVMKLFQRIVAMEKQRQAAAVRPEPPKEEPVMPATDLASDLPISPSPASHSELYTGYTEKKKGYLSTGRLVIGIISMVLFLFISFQSCAAGLSNTLQDNDALSGSAGLFTSIMFLAAGIVGVSTRNKKGIVGPIIAAVLYFIGAAFTIGTGDTYGDLPIWGALSTIFGLVFVFCAVKIRTNKTEEPFHKPLWLIIAVVVVAILALVVAFTGSGGSDNNAKDTSSKTKTEQNESSQVKKINMENKEGSLTFKKFKTTKDYDGKPAVVIHFDYTNKKDSASIAQETFHPQVFQNGVECTMGISEDDSKAIRNASKEVQKGTTIEIAYIYTIEDSKGSITLKVSDQSPENLFNDVYQEQEITLK